MKRMLNSIELARRIYWLTPTSVVQAVSTKRLPINVVKVGRRNYYDPAEVDAVVRAHEIVHGGASMADRERLHTLCERLEKAKKRLDVRLMEDIFSSSEFAYLCAEEALGKQWTDEFLSAFRDFD